MHQLLSYGKSEPVFDNNAYALGVTYQAGTGTVLIYSTHVAPTGSGGSSEYHITPVEVYLLVGTRQQYLRGVAAVRNGREMAREWRNGFISAANERARQPSLELSHCAPAESRTLADRQEEYGYDSLSDIAEESP